MGTYNTNFRLRRINLISLTNTSISYHFKEYFLFEKEFFVLNINMLYCMNLRQLHMSFLSICFTGQSSLIFMQYCSTSFCVDMHGGFIAFNFFELHPLKYDVKSSILHETYEYNYFGIQVKKIVISLK